MINLHKSGPINTVTIYPDSGSIYATNPNVAYEFELVQDYDQKTTIVSATLINYPTEFSPRLTLQLPTNEVPDASGLYTFSLYEYLAQQIKWIEAHTIWAQTHVQWGESGRSGVRKIEENRAFVAGTDTPTFTQYVSPDETGKYTTYNG